MLLDEVPHPEHLFTISLKILQVLNELQKTQLDYNLLVFIVDVILISRCQCLHDFAIDTMLRWVNKSSGHTDVPQRNIVLVIHFILLEGLADECHFEV